MNVSDDPTTSSSPPVLQQFRAKDGKPLQSIQTHPIGRFRDLFVYWSDIQDAFPDICHLLDDRGERVLFEITGTEDEYELASPIRIKASRRPLTAVNWSMADTISGSATIDFNNLLAWREHMFSGRPDTARSPEVGLYVNFSMHLLIERQRLDLRVQAKSQESDGAGALNELDTPHEPLESSVPRLFLLLPSDLESWDDSNPSTHSFRLYFLCDHEHESLEERYPTYVHLSNHSGYDLDQVQEFIRQFGCMSLTILEAAKSGYISPYCCIPKLETFQILDSLAGAPVQHSLTPAILGPLINQAIAYIREQLSVQSQQTHQTSYSLRSIANAVVSCFTQQRDQVSQPNMSTSGPITRSIRSFLRLQNGDNGMGGLNRILCPHTMRYLCQGHAFVHSDIEALEQYVLSLGGSIDLQLSTIGIDFHSMLQVDTFTAAAVQCNHIFDLSLDFKWSPSRKELQSFLEQIAHCKSSTIHIEGLTADSHQSSSEYTRDLFACHLGINARKSAQLIYLASHSQSSESYVYLGKASSVFGFLFDGTVDHRNVDWVEVGSSLDVLASRLHKDASTHGKDPAATLNELTHIVELLVLQGLKAIDLFHHQTNIKQCRLGMEDGAITGIKELYLPSFLFNQNSEKYPVLQRLIVRPGTNGILDSLYEVKTMSPVLELAEIPARESQAIIMMFLLYDTWPSTRFIHITLFEHNSEGDRAPLAKLLIGREHKLSPANIDILEWNYSHISEVLEDWGAYVLDLASQRCPTSLVSLALNTFMLSDRGLVYLQTAMARSEIQFLNIECGAFDPSLASYIGYVLEAVNWPALKSLELAGDSIDSWVDLWAKYGDIMKQASSKIHLLRLSIVGSSRQGQRLSHFNALWLHSVIYVFLPVEVCLKNIDMEAGDWELIRGANGDRVPEMIACNNT